MKEEEAGEVPVAFVVSSKDSQITENEIKQFVSKQVCIAVFLINIYIPKGEKCTRKRKRVFGFWVFHFSTSVT